MKIAFVGDINLGEYYLSFGHGPRRYLESDSLFEAVQPIFEKVDFVVGNLEAAITSINLNPLEPESMVLRGNPEHAHFLKGAGFGLLQVANNHTVQHGFEGFDESLKVLEELDIQTVGLNNECPVSIERNGIKVGFLAASDVPDNTHKSQQRYQRLNDAFISKAISEVGNYDHLIVMLHWGLESSTKPLDYQREIAAKLCSGGVRAIIGSHPHLVYEIEKSDNFICAYSLGNFVFDLCWDRRMLKSGILCLELLKSGINAEFFPIEIKKNGCFPVPVGTSVPIEETLVPYDLGRTMNWQQQKKILYYFKNLFLGDTSLKIKFILKKILGTVC